jgi:hypothetical protein
VLRFALGISNDGFRGLMAIKMIKVVTPKKMRIMLNMRHRIEVHHINGLVRRGWGLLNLGGFIDIFSYGFGLFGARFCWFTACFDITIWSRDIEVASFRGEVEVEVEVEVEGWGGGGGGGGGGSIFGESVLKKNYYTNYQVINEEERWKKKGIGSLNKDQIPFDYVNLNIYI